MMSTEVPPDDVERAQPPAPRTPVAAARVAYPLRGMLKKEFTELVPGYIMMTAILAVVYAMMVFTAMPREAERREGWYLTAMFRDATGSAVPIIAMCLCGALIGGIQFYRESKIDVYAFLTHRPISRTRIFVCRVFSAHLALILIVLPPTLLFYGWAMTREVAPERLIRDWLVHTLAGIFAASGSYLLGVLIVMRVKAKWYGTLFLPIFSAFLGGLLVGTRETPWVFIALALIMLIPMFAASHGAFATFAQVRSQRWYERFALGLLLLPALMLLVVMAGALTWTVLPKGSLYPEWVVPIVQKDGTPALLYNGRYYYKAIHTLDDKTIQVNPDVDTLPRAYSLRAANGSRYRPEWNVFGKWNRLFDSQECELENHKYYISAEWRNEKFFWLYNHFQETATVGSIDSKGLRLSSFRPIVPFADHVMPLDKNKVVVGNGIYDLLPDGRLKHLWTLPDSLPFTNIGLIAAGHGHPIEATKFKEDLLIATEQHLYLIDYSRINQSQEFVIKKQWPREPGNWDMTLFWLTPEDPVIRYDAKDRSRSLLVYTSDGKRVTVPAPHDQIPPMAYWPWGTLLLKSSVGLVGRGVDIADQIYFNRGSWSWSENCSMLFEQPEAIVTNVCVLLASLATSLVMRRNMARQYFSVQRRQFWMLLAFICGPSALLLRPAIVPTRVQEECPDCQKRRPVELVNCPHCGKPWPAPARDGREIIA